MVRDGHGTVQLSIWAGVMTPIAPTLPGAPSAYYLRMQFFPAIVQGLTEPLPDDDLKVFVTDAHLVIVAPLSTTSATGFYVAFVGVLEDYFGFNRATRMWHLRLDTGEEVAIGRAESCGCGSKLRSFALYPRITYR